MKKILLIFTLLLFTNISFAQYSWTKAEVTLKNGTVLVGEAFISMTSAGINIGSKEKLRFRKNKKAKGKNSKYLPAEVEQVIFTVTYKEKVGKKKVEKTRKEKYAPIYLNKKQTKLGFAELIVDGSMKLVGRTVSVNSGGGTWSAGTPYSAPVYTYDFGFLSNHNQVMFLKDGMKPEVFNQVSLLKSFKNRAKNFFEDCPALVGKIENKIFKKEDLIAIAEFYNSNCN